MTIKTGEFSPLPQTVADSLDIPRYYWQSVTYSYYTSRGWFFSANPPIEVEANQPLVTRQGEGKRLRQVIKRGAYANELLHASGFPLSTDQAVEANYDSSGDLVAAAFTSPPLTYTVQSWQPNHAPSRLRAAGTDYPEAIKQFYLVLPDSVPNRVTNLALNLTTAQPTPYDKAVAIENHLRSFPYTLDVPRPPPGVDLADYFLFELQQGYCDYYATSMVVLARAAGLPARFVIGYAPGFYDALRAEYRITEKDAHSWVQIYFPEIGWVDFEPTAGQPALQRRDYQAPPPSLELLPMPEIPAAPPQPEGMVVHPFWYALVIVGISYLAIQIQNWRLRRLPPKILGQTLYQRLLRSAERAGFVVVSGYTPYEFAKEFTTYLEQQLTEAPLYRLKQTHFAGVQNLVEIFVRQQYAPPQTAANQKKSLLNIWRTLRLRLWQAVFIMRLFKGYPNFLATKNKR
jgi:transglutaminase-like putative cysteine protease